MKKMLTYAMLLMSIAIYLVSIVGIGVHTCGETGQHIASLAYGSLDCEPLHSGGCCSSEDSGDCSSIACSHCHTEIFSVSDDADTPSLSRIILQSMSAAVLDIPFVQMASDRDDVCFRILRHLSVRYVPDGVHIGSLTVIRI